MQSQLGLFLFLSSVGKLTFGKSDGEVCDSDVDMCLNYDGHHSKKVESASGHCLERSRELLAIDSPEMLDFVERFFKNRMSKYFLDENQGFNAFVHLEQSQSREIFIDRGLEVQEEEMMAAGFLCTRVKLRSNWTLRTCPTGALLPIVCSKRASGNSFLLQCLPAYFLYLSLLVFGIGLAILFAVVIFGFRREIRLRKRRRSRNGQNIRNPDHYEEIGLRSDPCYTTVNNTQDNNYHNLETAETILEAPCNGMITMMSAV